MEVLTLISQFLIIFIHSYGLIDSNFHLCVNRDIVIFRLGMMPNVLNHFCLTYTLGDFGLLMFVDFGIIEQLIGMIVFRGS